jgi:hypothetical protein
MVASTDGELFWPAADEISNTTLRAKAKNEYVTRMIVIDFFKDEG